MRLLQIDSSILGPQSVSRQLTSAVVERFRAVDPGLTVTYRDLVAQPLPHQSGSLLAARAGGVESPSKEIVAAVEATAAALEEFLAADVVVIGAPMYNFGIPSQLKVWIDSLAVAGRTFAYTEKGPQGLCGGKRLIIASSRGGYYSVPSPIAAMDHQEAYLRGFFGFLGVIDIEFVRAEGVNTGAANREAAISGALAEAAALA